MKTHKDIEKKEDKLARALPAAKRKAFIKVQAEERQMEKKEKKPRAKK